MFSVCSSAKLTAIGHSSTLHTLLDCCSALRLRQTTQQGDEKLKSPHLILCFLICFVFKGLLCWLHSPGIVNGPACRGKPWFCSPKSVFWRQILGIIEVNSKALTAFNEKRFQSCFSGGFPTVHWTVSKGRSQIIAQHIILEKGDNI